MVTVFTVNGHIVNVEETYNVPSADCSPSFHLPELFTEPSPDQLINANTYLGTVFSYGAPFNLILFSTTAIDVTCSGQVDTVNVDSHSEYDVPSVLPPFLTFVRDSRLLELCFTHP